MSECINLMKIVTIPQFNSTGLQRIVIILLLNSLWILTNLNLKLVGYSTEITILGIIKLQTKLNLAY